MANGETTALAVSPECRDLDATCAVMRQQLRECTGQFGRAMIVAEAINRLEAAISPAMMQAVMRLQGNTLGFLTDKDKDKEPGYPENAVRRCIVEAILRGWQLAGNEMNIIAGRPYGTKAGLARNLREFPGLENLKRTFGVPKLREGGAIVEHQVSWTINGVPDQISGELGIRVNAGQGVDAILGKAHRKQSALVLDRLTGSSQTIDGEVEDLPDVEGRARGQLPSLTDAINDRADELARQSRQQLPAGGEGSVQAVPPQREPEPPAASAGEVAPATNSTADTGGIRESKLRVAAAAEVFLGPDATPQSIRATIIETAQRLKLPVVVPARGSLGGLTAAQWDAVADELALMKTDDRRIAEALPQPKQTGKRRDYYDLQQLFAELAERTDAGVAMTQVRENLKSWLADNYDATPVTITPDEIEEACRKVEALLKGESES